jgi:hypothetical protein
MRIEPNTSVKVIVIARDPYGGDPVIEVQKNEVYSFQANEGKTWKDWFIPSSAEGCWNPALLLAKKRVKEARCFTLCGTIDQNEENHFIIGAGLKSFSILQSGELYFFANDSLNFYCNNKGCMTVEVRREY